MVATLEILTRALSDRYRIERELGRGGMATVYPAEDLKHHRRVAIKVLDPEVGAAIGPERFVREIETVARLSHPHILPLFDSGQAAGLLYYVMPYVEGESLRDRLNREKQLPLDDALKIAREVADALSCAHSHGLIHRDIKPENILLQEGHAVVADFGVARAVVATGGEKLTATGIAVGTSAYMSPEQAAGGRNLDGRSDLYSLGCVLYEMLAGVPPFAGTTAESLAHQHLNLTPRPVTELRPAVPAALADALQRALAKTAADRFNQVALFGEALGTDWSGAVVAAAPTAATGQPRSRRGLALMSLALVALVAVAAWQRRGPVAEWLGGPGGHAPAKKEWILVAEFDGPSGDTTLASAARSLVSAALDQSEILAIVPRDQIQLALRQAGKPANTRVSAEVARELAYRRAVRGVLEGDIARIGQRYSVVLRVVDAESLRVVVTESGSAKNEDALIPVLGRLAEKLRRELGERRSAIAATRPMTAVATPSFEAYRLYVDAARLSHSSYHEGAIVLLREALRLDPGFVNAWISLGVADFNTGRPDSALVAYEQAGRRPERMTVTGRLMLESRRAATEGDMERALALRSRLLQIDPANVDALGLSALSLQMLGRFEEALARNQQVVRLSPFGAGSAALGNQVENLLSLGRLDQAREAARPVPGLMGPDVRTDVELAAGNWAAAESMATAQTQDPRLVTAQRSLAFGSLAQAQAGRGALRAAASTLMQSARIAQGASLALHQVNAGRTLLFLSDPSPRGHVGARQFDRGVALPRPSGGDGRGRSHGTATVAHGPPTPGSRNRRAGCILGAAGSADRGSLRALGGGSPHPAADRGAVGRGRLAHFPPLFRGAARCAVSPGRRFRETRGAGFGSRLPGADDDRCGRVELLGRHRPAAGSPPPRPALRPHGPPGRRAAPPRRTRALVGPHGRRVTPHAGGGPQRSAVCERHGPAGGRSDLLPTLPARLTAPRSRTNFARGLKRTSYGRA
jgi:tRNA A-37 threonylcarbamoyl transferase component Bud32/tetratricopeptide (TPR) repeat protein